MARAGAGNVLTTHHLKLDPAAAPEVVERLRAALPGYPAERPGMISAALYCSQDGSEVVLVGHWHDVADVTRSMETIHANAELGVGVQSGNFGVYSLVDEVEA